jgi:hypothetical protein
MRTAAQRYGDCMKNAKTAARDAGRAFRLGVNTAALSDCRAGPWCAAPIPRCTAPPLTREPPMRQANLMQTIGRAISSPAPANGSRSS